MNDSTYKLLIEKLIGLLEALHKCKQKYYYEDSRLDVYHIALDLLFSGKRAPGTLQKVDQMIDPDSGLQWPDDAQKLIDEFLIELTPLSGNSNIYKFERLMNKYDLERCVWYLEPDDLNPLILDLKKFKRMIEADEACTDHILNSQEPDVDLPLSNPESIAWEVDELVRQFTTMRRFREQITELAILENVYQKARSDYDEIRKMHCLKVLEKERLRDKKAGSPEVGWVWCMDFVEKESDGKFMKWK